MDIAVQVGRTGKLTPVALVVIIVGVALLISDALHHFVVMWIATGAPEFNFFYDTAPPG